MPLSRGGGVTDIDLSVDDRRLYVSCWGTGELKQYDVSDPHNPTETGSVRLGGIVRHTPHPAAPDLELSGGPQMVEVSRDGRRVYVTNSLYATWDDIFYPDGVGAWAARIDASPGAEAITLDPAFFPHGDDFRGLRVHQPASRAAMRQATRTASWSDQSRLTRARASRVSSRKRGGPA